jgi:opacity protein-like surface antigen
MRRLLLPLSAALLFGSSALASQAVPRTDTPRAGVLRVTFDPVIETWEREFTANGRQRIGATLPGPVFVRAERRTTPLTVEFGISNRVSLSARLPLVRVRTQAGYHRDSTGTADSGSAVLDSLLADPTYDFAPVRNTPRRLRYFPGDAELQAKYLLFVAPSYRTAVALVVRFPTGHLDSPHDLFDVSTGDHQTDVEAQITQELILAERFWLNVAFRAARQRPGTRERRVGPQDSLLLPRANTALLDWTPGDYAAIDIAPMYRFSPTFGAGFTAGYWTKKGDRYAYRSAADSIAGVPASALDAGTAERRLRLGVAATYIGVGVEGSFSVEQTVSGAGGRIPAATVFRIVMRTSRWPF